MSKVISIQGNQDFTGYEVTTDLPVNNIRSADFTLNQKQLITKSGVTDNDFGSACSISGDGLWMVTGGSSTSAGIFTYSRNNINEEFVFSSTILSGPCGNIDISEDGKYIIVENPEDSAKIYSRNTTTDAWSQRATLANHFKVAMSPDGNYAVAMDPNKNSSFLVTPFKKDVGADTWTALTGFSPTTTTLVTSSKKTIDISNNGERIIFITNGGTEIWRRTTNTSYTLEQTLGSGNDVNVRINKTGDLLLTENNVYSRSGITWTLETTIDEPSYGTAVSNFGSYTSMSKDGNRLIIYDNATVNAKVGRFSIYDKIANNNWRLVATLDSLVNELGQSADSLFHSFDVNDDGTILVTSGEISGVYVYDIENEVSFSQIINAKTINFNDTVKLTSSAGSSDHLLTFPAFNQAGSFINDGSGNALWSTSFDQSLNKSDAVQFDCWSITPTLGVTINDNKRLCLSMRQLNSNYEGYCVKVRRDTDFFVDLVSDLDLDSNSSISGTPSYSGTSGSSLRGQITATLVASYDSGDTTGSGLVIDGVGLGPDNDGIVRILLVGQTNPEENGIYTTTISGTSLTLDRATDFDEDSEVFENQTFYVTLGDTYINTGFQLTTTDPVIIGGTGGSNLTFSVIDVIKDIGFSNNVIDIATLTTFLDGSDGYVQSWYDQSGNGNDFTQMVRTQQPKLALTRGINWLPTLEFDGTDDFLDGGDILDMGTSTGILVNVVAQVSTGGGNLINKGSGVNSWGIAYGSTFPGTIDFRYYDTVDSTESTSAIADGSNEVLTLDVNRNAGTKTFGGYVNSYGQFTNISITEDSSYDFSSTGNAILGAYDNSGLSNHLNGKISEVVVLDNEQTENSRLGLEQEQINYYGIINPPVAKDLILSMKQFGNFTGNCVKVRRGTSGTTLDIGFKDGIIDTAELTSFLNGESGYVETWYDQSGNGYNFTQIDTDKQPEIILTGGILSTLPAISFDGNDDFLDGGDVLNLGQNTAGGILVNAVAQVSTSGGTIIQKGYIENAWGLSYTPTTLDFIYADSVISNTSATKSPTGSNEIITLSVDRRSNRKQYGGFVNNSSYASDVSITEDNTYDFVSVTPIIQQNISDVYLGSVCMSGDGLWAFIGNLTAARIEAYKRSNLYENFTFSSSFGTGANFGRWVAVDHDASYITTVTGSGGLSKVYERNTTTDVWTLDTSYSSYPSGSQQIAPDSSYAVAFSKPLANNSNQVYTAKFVRLSAPSTWVTAGSINVGTSNDNSQGEMSNGGNYFTHHNSNNNMRIITRTGTSNWATQYQSTTDGLTTKQKSSMNYDGDLVVAGRSGQNEVYVFTRSGSTWSKTQSVFPDSSLSSVSNFGGKIKVSGDGTRLIVHDEGSSGRISIYDRINGLFVFNTLISGITTGLGTYTGTYAASRSIYMDKIGSAIIAGRTTETVFYIFNLAEKSVALGTDPTRQNYLEGIVSEVIIIKDNVSNSERLGIETVQSNYYEITNTTLSKINFKINPSISSDYTLTFPSSQGSNNQTLTNDGSGNLTWTTVPSTFTTTSTLTITDTTPATNATTGALIVSGGASIGENIYVNGRLAVKVRTESTSTTLGSDYVLNMDNTGTETVTVPDATLSENEGTQYIIIKINSSPGTVNVTCATGTQLFSGGSSFSTISLTGGKGERMVLLCNGTYWYVM